MVIKLNALFFKKNLGEHDSFLQSYNKTYIFSYFKNLFDRIDWWNSNKNVAAMSKF